MNTGTPNDRGDGQNRSPSIFSSDFWKSLPGVLTALAAFIGALTAAYALFHPKTDSSVVTPAKPAATNKFEVVRAADGYVSLRAAPTKSSAELKRIPVGEILLCGTAQMDASAHHHPWRPCSDADGAKGFASDYYLQRVVG